MTPYKQRSSVGSGYLSFSQEKDAPPEELPKISVEFRVRQHQDVVPKFVQNLSAMLIFGALYTWY